MNFRLDDEAAAFRDSTRRVARDIYRDMGAQLERDGTPLPAAERTRLAELGLLGITLPETYGGAGAPLLFAVLAIEELARESQTAAFPVFEAATGPARVIELFGSEEQRARWLPEIVAGRRTMAIAISEAEAGSAATDLRTTGRRDGGDIVVDGAKQWCSGAGHAELYLVYCRMSEAPGAAGIGAVVVERDTPGLEFGPRRHHMGFRGIPHADMFFSGCRVSERDVVVTPGGFRQLFSAFSIERLGNAAMSLGIAASALAIASEHVGVREQFGHPVLDFQAVQVALADMVMRTEAARLLLWRAASNAGSGAPEPLEASIAKCYANETARFVARTAMDLMGASGYSTERPLERHLRDSHGWAIAGGTPAMQRIRIASEFTGRRFDQRAGGSRGRGEADAGG